jgi:tetratricopeptide (TPR) repeat protein
MNMKSLIIAVVGAGVAAGILFYVERPKTATASAPETLAEPLPSHAPEDLKLVEPVVAKPEHPVAPPEQPGTSKPLPPAPTPSTYAKLEASNLNGAVDLLVSPQATYEQKQATWKQLRESGKIDPAIRELEQRTANDPRVAQYPAALGQAYLQKCATIQDVREQGILAMQADKVFDTALTLDPSNWEARFTKAVALSYWPANLNKGGEVIQHFQTLVEQQETQAPQPQFAETYAWLGDQYAKAGRDDYARTAWERGAALFPNHEGLKNKLATAPVAQASASGGAQ